MKFYFPDAQDVIYPGYDFVRDEYPAHRVRQRDDRYCHEVLDPVPYDGLLLSKAIIDGVAGSTGKYSVAQRDRLYRRGARRFFRLPDELSIMGDCGAFSYVSEDAPPVGVSELLDFYQACGCDSGVSIDHLILAYAPETGLLGADPEWQRRRRLSLDLGEEFLRAVRDRGSPLHPVGAAQGWSPASYAASVAELQDMGYDTIALGSLVPLKTGQILEVVQGVAEVLKPGVDLHLLGIARPEAMEQFADYGVTSFDSTSPLRQAFMDDRNNYHTAVDHYVAIRVPQVDGNPRLKRRILSGVVSQSDAMRLERETLQALWAFDRGQTGKDDALEQVLAYEALTGDGKKTYAVHYDRMLTDQPWKACGCTLCRAHGIDIAIFRGSERNKRRGFHNLAVLGRKVPGRTTALETAHA